MRCFDCGKEFKSGDVALEITRGVFNGEYVVADTTYEVWCEECEEKRAEK